MGKTKYHIPHGVLFQVAEWAAEGRSLRSITDELVEAGLNLDWHSLRRSMISAGIKRRGQRKGQEPRVKVSAHRAVAMAEMYRAGLTLEQVGEQYGISRERVRQLLGKHEGMCGKDGGKCVRSERNRLSFLARKDERYLRTHGCTWAQYVEVRAIGAKMKANGKGWYRSPLGAFTSQRNNAKTRDIPWRLKFWDWWQIWQRSGKWEQRGRGQGYVMARHLDKGAYEIDNVYITTAVNNIVQGVRKSKYGLPRGVRLQRGRLYAQRSINGVTFNAGPFETAEKAHAAYEMMLVQPLPGGCRFCGSKEPHNKQRCHVRLMNANRAKKVLQEEIATAA